MEKMEEHLSTHCVQNTFLFLWKTDLIKQWEGVTSRLLGTRSKNTYPDREVQERKAKQLLKVKEWYEEFLV